MPVTSTFPKKRCCLSVALESGISATIAEYAENVCQCKWFASRTKDEDERKFLLRMAKRWRELAAEKERDLREAARPAV
jgi:hypothetical protein